MAGSCIGCKTAPTRSAAARALRQMACARAAADDVTILTAATAPPAPSCQMASAAWTNSAAVHWMADSIPPTAAANETFDHSRAPPIALSASINHAPVSPNARRSTQRSAPPTTPPPPALRPVDHSAPRGTRAWYAATETSAIRAAPHALRPRRECSDARSRAIPPSTPASGISHAPSPSATRWTCSRTSGTPVAPGRNESASTSPPTSATAPPA